MPKSGSAIRSLETSNTTQPRFMNGDAIIARDDDQSFRLIVPFDQAIGRAVKDVVSLQLLPGSAPAAAGS